MKKSAFFTAIILSLFLPVSSMAMDKKMDHSTMKEKAMDHSNMKKDGMDHSNMKKEEMDHSKMEHGSMMKDGHFTHATMVDGIHAEFQIMSLASMNMKDPEGKTHHVMASFMKDMQKIEKAAGKVKLIAPSGKEQISPLKNYGGGAFAANFNFDEPGKWGVICLFKDSAGKHTVKFWYEHPKM